MMISYFKNFEANKLKAKSSKLNKGFTYVELIVVLGIFAVMSAVIIFNYGEFQSKVDIKSLASDIASKIVEAQNSSLNGLLPSTGVPYTGWKPSYGVYFTSLTSDPTHGNASNKDFIYFVDLSSAGGAGYNGTGTLDSTSITNGDVILRIDICTDSCVPVSSSPTSFSVEFKRPDSSAIFTDSNGVSLGLNGSQYIQITIQSPKTAMALIKIYPSGRIQVN